MQDNYNSNSASVELITLAFQFWNPIPKQIGNIMDSSSDHVDVKGTNDAEFLQPEGINLPFRKLCVCIRYIR